MKGVRGGIIAVMLAAMMAVPTTAWADDAGEDGGQITVTVPEGGGSEGDISIVDAQFRWGLNAESGAGAFAGGCNFLSAGRAGDVGAGGIVWTAAHDLYRASDGAVRIEKPDAGGEFRPATWADRCLDASGAPLTTASLTQTSGNHVVIDGGTGTLSTDGRLRITWKGSFTVVFYGGMTYWSVTDPVLAVDSAGNGTVTATASGYGASMEDLSRWEALPERSIVLANLSNIRTEGGSGFMTEPLYHGVAVTDAGQAERTAENQAYWGSFPASFVQYQKLTGQAGYWLTTGGQRDKAKVPTTLYISYDARAPIVVTPVPGISAGGGGAVPQNTVRVRPPGAAAPAAAAPQSAAQAAAVPASAVYPLGDSVTLSPAAAALVPEGMPMGLGNLALLALLATLFALCMCIVSVLNIMGALPWHKRATT